MYKLYAKIKDDIIIEIKTEAFIKDPTDYVEIGEQEGRHYHEPVSDDIGHLYKLVKGEKVLRAFEDRKGGIIESLVSEIKGKANDVILAKYPMWMQNNLQARFTELLDKDTLTTEEQDEKDAIYDVWDWVKSIRYQSNDFEQELEGLTEQELIDYKIEYLV